MSAVTFDPSATEDLLSASKSMDDTTIEIRRAIHAEPELGLELPETQSKILEALTGLGLDITLGESTTSVVAELDSGRPGPTVLLRGDMDALPMQEDFVSDFQSKHEQRMHACGHDSHVAMLVSAAHVLAGQRSELTGKVRFMFQPGEEGHHGAKYMIEEGVCDGVDRAFAIHVLSNLPNGQVFTKGGPLMASADRFEITMHGKGGHASMPHDTIDPIPPAAATVGALSSLVSREVPAAPWPSPGRPGPGAGHTDQWRRWRPGAAAGAGPAPARPRRPAAAPPPHRSGWRRSSRR